MDAEKVIQEVKDSLVGWEELDLSRTMKIPIGDKTFTAKTVAYKFFSPNGHDSISVEYIPNNGIVNLYYDNTVSMVENESDFIALFQSIVKRKLTAKEGGE